MNNSRLNKYIILLACSLIILGGASCTDYLERAPESIINENEVFKNFTNFQGYTEEMYMLIPDVAKHAWCSSFNWGDDEHQFDGEGRYFTYHIDRGNFRWYLGNNDDGGRECFLYKSGWNSSSDRMGKDIWNSGWYAIRKCNLGIAAIEEKGLLVDATEEERNMLLGQLYFFRGFWHFQIMQYWGPMPYIDRDLGGQKLDLPRPTYHECAQKAGDDFRKAADLLPINWDNTTPGRKTMGNNELRANKIWALSYLGKNYLWAGSPLMTHGPTGNPDSYDQELCKKAAAAFAEIIDLVEKGQTQYSLVPFENYSNLFYTFKNGWRIPGSTEAIVRGPSYENNSRWRQSESYHPGAELGGGADPQRLFPAANYVNFFGMKNGLPLNDGGSGFDKTRPWKDRDPRFYAIFAFDGVKVVSTKLDDEKTKLWTYANLYTGGSYRDPKYGNQCETGYMLKKFVTLGCNGWDKDADNYSNALMIMLTWVRLADVYLMYAESAAQGYQSPTGKDSRISLTAVDAINKIRDRAGAGRVDGKFTGSLAAFMPEVRRERAVELAFEGHRFNDLRRWLLFDKAPYNVKTGQEFDRVGTFNAEKPEENQVANFREVPIPNTERKFDSKHYWLPIKTKDVNLYEGFSQNPGW